ncbi:MAG: hypothetical protein ABII10_03110 [Candidatus Paceibacterota bacterium]
MSEKKSKEEQAAGMDAAIEDMEKERAKKRRKGLKGVFAQWKGTPWEAGIPEGFDDDDD